MISGEAARWLSARREELNGRFRVSKKAHPSLDGESFSVLLSSLLTPVQDSGSADLYSVLFDLALLHAGRDTLATRPGLARLLHESFPRLAPWLVREPSLAGALSNAVENLAALGGRGDLFAKGAAELGACVESPEQLLAAAALLSWRLGEARLRDAALDRAKEIPKRAVLVALDLADWPPAAAPLALAALEGDAFTSPRDVFTPETVARAGASAAALSDALGRLANERRSPSTLWVVSARLGDFSGFGGAAGAFDVPPTLLDAGSPHTLHVRCLARSFVVFGDVYGCVAREGPPVAAAIEKRPRLPFPPPAGATSFAVFDDAIAVAFRDSHRISVFVPRREKV